MSKVAHRMQPRTKVASVAPSATKRAILSPANRQAMAATAGTASISERIGKPLTGNSPWPSWRGRQDRAASQTHIHKRSEEHTSELQSLMRISYAVFCLKNKKQQQKLQIQYEHNNNTQQNNKQQH